MLASSSSSSGSLGRHGFMASMNSVIGASSKEKRKRRATKKDKKPPPPSTDETQGMLMRGFAEGVTLQDYTKDESSESGKSLSTTTPGSLSPSFKDVEKRREGLSPKGASPKLLEVCTLITQKSG